MIAWTLFARGERRVFRDAVGLPEGAWARARGWALWKALVTLCDPASPLYPQQARALEELFAERGDA